MPKVVTAELISVRALIDHVLLPCPPQLENELADFGVRRLPHQKVKWMLIADLVRSAWQQSEAAAFLCEALSNADDAPQWWDWGTIGGVPIRRNVTWQDGLEILIAWSHLYERVRRAVQSGAYSGEVMLPEECTPTPGMGNPGFLDTIGFLREDMSSFLNRHGVEALEGTRRASGTEQGGANTDLSTRIRELDRELLSPPTAVRRQVYAAVTAVRRSHPELAELPHQDRRLRLAAWKLFSEWGIRIEQGDAVAKAEHAPIIGYTYGSKEVRIDPLERKQGTLGGIGKRAFDKLVDRTARGKKPKTSSPSELSPSEEAAP